MVLVARKSSKVLAAVIGIFLSQSSPLVAETAYERPDWLYLPKIAFGPASAPEIIFFWSAVSNESMGEFQKRIAPLIRGREPKSRIVLWQLMDGRAHDLIGPGSWLLCPGDWAHYVVDATAYLSTATENVANVIPITFLSDQTLFTNTTIEHLREKGLINLPACAQNPQFHIKRERLAADTKLLVGKFKLSSPPAYVVNGITMRSNDPRVSAALKAAE